MLCKFRPLLTWLSLVGIGLLCGPLSWAGDKDQSAQNEVAKSGQGVSGIELQYQSKTVKPGDNFYEFVNQGWLEATEIPADQSNYGSFSELDDEAKEAIRALIEEAAAENAAAGSDSQKVGDFFKSLTDIEHRNSLGTQPIEPLLAKVREIKTKKQLATALAELFRIGIAGPLVAMFHQMPSRATNTRSTSLRQG